MSAPSGPAAAQTKSHLKLHHAITACDLDTVPTVLEDVAQSMFVHNSHPAEVHNHHPGACSHG